MTEYEERAPLLGGTRKPSWSKAGIWCCCSVLPIAVITLLWLATRHASIHGASSSSTTHSIHAARSRTPSNVVPHEYGASKVQRAKVAEQHDWADDYVPAEGEGAETWRDQEFPKPSQHIERASQRLEKARQPSAATWSDVAKVTTAAPAALRGKEQMPVVQRKAPEYDKARQLSVPKRIDATKAKAIPPVAWRDKEQPPVPKSTATPLAMELTAHCTLPLQLNYLCSGIIQTALGAEQARIQAELHKHLPPWVREVKLKYESGSLVAEPLVRLASRPQQRLFGFNPKMRLRCTFEALMRSPKVLAATKLLSEYSGGLCSATAGTPHCTAEKTTDTSSCDPLGDVLISAP